MFFSIINPAAKIITLMKTSQRGGGALGSRTISRKDGVEASKTIEPLCTKCISTPIQIDPVRQTLQAINIPRTVVGRNLMTVSTERWNAPNTNPLSNMIRHGSRLRVPLSKTPRNKISSQIAGVNASRIKSHNRRNQVSALTRSSRLSRSSQGTGSMKVWSHPIPHTRGKAPEITTTDVPACRNVGRRSDRVCTGSNLPTTMKATVGTKRSNHSAARRPGSRNKPWSAAPPQKKVTATSAMNQAETPGVGTRPPPDVAETCFSVERSKQIIGRFKRENMGNTSGPHGVTFPHRNN